MFLLLLLAVLSFPLGMEPIETTHEYVCPREEAMGSCQCQDSYMGLDIYCSDTHVDEVRSVLLNVTETNQIAWYVTLNHIEMSSLPSDLMTGLRVQNLVVVNCTNMTTLEEGIFEDTRLEVERLILPHNGLERVPSRALRKLSHLLYLNMKFNKLVALHADDFKGLDSLIHLSLYGNRIHFVHEFAFEGIGIGFMRLRLDSNELTTVPTGALRSASTLKILDLHDNKISALKSPEVSNTSLRHLTLADNEIGRLPAGAFASLTQLQTLDLSGNQIESIDPLAFQGLENTLVSLKLGNNSLTSVPSEALRNLSRLFSLDLQRNRIGKVRKDDFLPYGGNLANIFLQNNLLTSLEQATFIPLDSLKNLFIYGNPFHCDCKVYWLAEWMSGYGSTIVKVGNETKCASPEVHADAPLARVPKGQLVCENSMPPSSGTFNGCLANSDMTPSCRNFMIALLEICLVCLLITLALR